MNLNGTGVNDNVVQQVERTHGAARVSLRPPEKGVFGSYSLAMVTSGAFTAGAVSSGVISAWQWNIKGISMLLRRVWGSISTTTAFAQGDISLDILRASKLGSGQYTGGQTLIINDTGRRSTRFPVSQLLPVANTATGAIAIASNVSLSAPGTVWTFDDNAFGRYSNGGAQLGGLPMGLVYEGRAYDEPAEFQNGQGFVVRLNCPATGVINPVALVFEWDEIDPQRYFGILGG